MKKLREEIKHLRDTNDDGKFSKAEYLVNQYWDPSNNEVKSTGKEFSEVLDKNGDGVADKYEKYVDTFN